MINKNKRESTKRNIQKTFCDLIKEKNSYKEISLNEIVEKANITKTTFYRYYENIDDLINDLIFEVNNMIIKEIERMFIDSPTDYIDYFNSLEINLTDKEALFLPTITSFNASNYIEFFKNKFANEITILFNKYSKNRYGKGVLIQMLSLFLGATDLVINHYKGDNIFTIKEIFKEVNNNLKTIFKK